jgi:glycosyltransferase involved in cell wall biosynthesis
MRIAVINWNRRLEGGVETYLDKVIPALHLSGHKIAFCHEIDQPANRGSIRIPEGAPSWCTARLGIRQTAAALREWQPDLIYGHNIASLELERQTIKIAPGVFFAHGYQGTCISGSKTFTSPMPHPCARRFGWQCLVHFYPRRCGGLNPITMAALYRTQAARLALIKQYRLVLTNSEHMRAEYIRNGIPPDRVFKLQYCVLPLGSKAGDDPSFLKPRTLSKNEWRLAFAGRMEALKGGSVLLNAVRLLRARTDRSLHLTMAGEGPYRSDWEAVASRLQAGMRSVNIKFTGWLDDAQLAALFDESDLFVMPSLWPEPFGIVGVQAGLRGLPTAAFDVGGIPTWLVNGVSGHLAPGDPPTAEGLANAIFNCLSDRDHYLELRKGALATAGSFKIESHVADLTRLLEAAIHLK